MKLRWISCSKKTTKAIKKIPVRVGTKEDSWVWRKSPNGIVSVKSVYMDLLGSSTNSWMDPIKAKIWKAKIHEKQNIVAVENSFRYPSNKG